MAWQANRVDAEFEACNSVLERCIGAKSGGQNVVKTLLQIQNSLRAPPVQYSSDSFGNFQCHSSAAGCGSQQVGPICTSNVPNPWKWDMVNFPMSSENFQCHSSAAGCGSLCWLWVPKRWNRSAHQMFLKGASCTSREPNSSNYSNGNSYFYRNVTEMA